MIRVALPLNHPCMFIAAKITGLIAAPGGGSGLAALIWVGYRINRDKKSRNKEV